MDYNTAETIAAVSGEMEEDRERWQKVYDACADLVGGFIGMWGLWGQAGLAFDWAETNLKVEWDGEYPEAIGTFAAALSKALIDQRLTLESPARLTAQLRSLAKVAIHDEVLRHRGSLKLTSNKNLEDKPGKRTGAALKPARRR